LFGWDWPHCLLTVLTNGDAIYFDIEWSRPCGNTDKDSGGRSPKLFDDERQRFLIDLEAKVNLSAFDLFLASTPWSHQHKVLIRRYLKNEARSKRSSDSSLRSVPVVSRKLAQKFNIRGILARSVLVAGVTVWGPGRVI
jgi:hypothetical protein